MSKRVVITGIGVIAPNGIGKDEFWNSTVSGESGIGRVTRFDPSEYPSQVAGEVKDFDASKYMDYKLGRRLSRFAQFALAATRMAVDDASLKLDGSDEDLSYRTGISFATSIGGQELNEQQYDVFREKGVNGINPLCVSVINNNTALGVIAQEFRIKGPNMTICTGCSSALNAIAYGYDLIKNGRADVVIAGGSETPITPFAFDTFCAAQVLAKGKGKENPKTVSRPFEKSREGYILSEGAGVVVMESYEFAMKRKAKMYAEVSGYGVTNDGYNIFKMEPTGKEVVKAINLALDESGLEPEDIDYVNAHGSSSQVSDKRETMAIKEVFGESAYDIPVSSIKSMIGQPLATLMSIQENHLPPTINYEEEDPDCDLDYVPNKSRRNEVNSALINSFGLGGNNISMIVKRVDYQGVKNTAAINAGIFPEMYGNSGGGLCKTSQFKISNLFSGKLMNLRLF